MNTGKGRFREPHEWPRLIACPPQVKPGDSVLYFKYAGDKMQTPEGEQYVVVHDSDM